MPGTRLTSKLFIPILLLSFLAFGFSFDRSVAAKSAGANAYLIVVIGFIIAIAALRAVGSLAVRYPDRSIIALGDLLLGPAGRIGASIWLLAVFLLAALLAQRVTSEVAAIILFRTPGSVSALVFLLLAGYMALLGEEALGRLSSAMMTMLPVLLFLLFMSFRQVTFLNIHPVNIYRDPGYLRQWGLWLIVYAPIWVLSFSSGGESLRNNFKAVILTIASGAIVLAATFLSIAGSFGPRGMGRYEWPVISLFSIIEFAPRYFFQNFAVTIYLFIFLSFSLVTVAAFLRVIAKGLNELLGSKKDRSKLFLLFIDLCLFIMLISVTQICFEQVANILLAFCSLYVFGYSLLIWFSSHLRRRS